MPRILLIEPNHIIANQYRDFLISHGHEVELCTGAQDAVLSADNRKPDMVILELLLASHSGVEFLYEFRSYDEWRQIPVLILSRVSSHELGLGEKLIRELGISKLLYKPDTSMKQLLKEIGAALESTKASAPR